MKTATHSMETLREGTIVCITSWSMRAARMAMQHPQVTKGTIKLKTRAVKMKSSMINLMTEWPVEPSCDIPEYK